MTDGRGDSALGAATKRGSGRVPRDILARNKHGLAAALDAAMAGWPAFSSRSRHLR